MANQQRSSNPLGSFGYIAMAVLALVAIFFIARFAFNLIYMVAPLILIATLIIDYKVVVDFGKWMLKLFKMNPLYGIGASILTFFIYPIVAFFLLGKALLKKKIKAVTQELDKKVNGEFTEYEEVEEVIVEEEIVPQEEKLIELPPIPKKQKQAQAQPKSDNEYEDLF